MATQAGAKSDAGSSLHELAPIASFGVVGLHGKFNYEIDLLADSPAKGRAPLFAVNEDRLALLYGNNGTGKTTLLRMLFDGLSPANDRGHRHTLSGIKFKKFAVAFSNGDSVSYERDAPVSGPFHAVAAVGSAISEWDFEPGRPAGPTLEWDAATGVVVTRDPETPFLQALQSFAVNPVFLTDSRVLISDLVQPDDRRQTVFSTRVGSGGAVDRIVQEERDSDLRDALRRVRDYLRTLVLAGAQRGSERVDTVYATLAETIVKHASAVGRPRKSTIPNLQSRVEELRERAAGFTRYGLIPELPASRLLKALDNAQPKNGPLLDQVLTPYLDGLTQRMEELEAGRRAISGYVETINSFLERKLLDFRAQAGVSIIDEESREPLEPSDLSSGEKQILVLFGDVVALRERTRLFIIDEPELSLNPQWQRNLMPALLQSTQGTGMQLVAATHSIEIMAKYRDRLHRLILD